MKKKYIVFYSKSGSEIIEVFMISPTYIYGRTKAKKDLNMIYCDAFSVETVGSIIDYELYKNGQDGLIPNSFADLFEHKDGFELVDCTGKLVFDSKSEDSEVVHKIKSDEGFLLSYSAFELMIKNKEDIN